MKEKSMARLSVVTQDATAPTPLSETRAALALAIDTARITEKTLADAVEAESRGDAMVRETRQAWEDARERAEAAKGDLALAMAGAAGGGPAADRGALSRARAAEAEAADLIDAARAAQSVLREQRVQAESKHGYKAQAVKQAAGLVMQESVEALARDVSARQAALIRDRLTLRWMFEQKIIPDRAPLIPLRDVVILPGLENGPFDHGSSQLDRVAAAPWQAAFEALQADAGAVLPMQTAE